MESVVRPSVSPGKSGGGWGMPPEDVSIGAGRVLELAVDILHIAEIELGQHFPNWEKIITLPTSG